MGITAYTFCHPPLISALVVPVTAGVCATTEPEYLTAIYAEPLTPDVFIYPDITRYPVE